MGKRTIVTYIVGWDFDGPITSSHYLEEFDSSPELPQLAKLSRIKTVKRLLTRTFKPTTKIKRDYD